jgi:hypothetical protein
MSHKIKPWLLCFLASTGYCDKSKFVENMFLQEAESSSTGMKKFLVPQNRPLQTLETASKPARPPQVGATQPAQNPDLHPGSRALGLWQRPAHGFRHGETPSHSTPNWRRS